MKVPDSLLYTRVCSSLCRNNFICANNKGIREFSFCTVLKCQPPKRLYPPIYKVTFLAFFCVCGVQNGETITYVPAELVVFTCLFRNSRKACLRNSSV